MIAVARALNFVPFYTDALVAAPAACLSTMIPVERGQHPAVINYHVGHEVLELVFGADPNPYIETAINRSTLILMAPPEPLKRAHKFFGPQLLPLAKAFVMTPRMGIIRLAHYQRRPLAIVYEKKVQRFFGAERWSNETLMRALRDQRFKGGVVETLPEKYGFTYVLG